MAREKKNGPTTINSAWQLQSLFSRVTFVSPSEARPETKSSLAVTTQSEPVLIKALKKTLLINNDVCSDSPQPCTLR